MADLPARAVGDLNHISDHNTLHALVGETEDSIQLTASSQITTLTDKATPVSTDVVVIEQSTGEKFKADLGNLPAASAAPTKTLGLLLGGM